MKSLEGFGAACRAEVRALGGGVSLKIGDRVDFVYGSECWSRTREGLRCDVYSETKGESGLLNRGEPVELLEMVGDDARISTKSNGEVWTFLSHLKPTGVAL